MLHSSDKNCWKELSFLWEKYLSIEEKYFTHLWTCFIKSIKFSVFLMQFIKEIFCETDCLELTVVRWLEHNCTRTDWLVRRKILKTAEIQINIYCLKIPAIKQIAQCLAFWPQINIWSFLLNSQLARQINFSILWLALFDVWRARGKERKREKNLIKIVIRFFFSVKTQLKIAPAPSA